MPTKNKDGDKESKKEKVIKSKVKKEKKKLSDNDIKNILDIETAFDDEEKNNNLKSISVNAVPDLSTYLHSGSLGLDLAIGGGLKPGAVYELWGTEHAGKTASLHEILGQALKFIPRQTKGLFQDFEGKIEPIWTSHIYGVDDISQVYGFQDEDTQKWLITPQIRYYKPSNGDQGLKFLIKVLNKYPNKVLIGKRLYYEWISKEPKVVNKTGGYTATMLKEKLGDNYSKKMLNKYGNYYVRVPNNYDGPELVIGLDSWATMTPKATAEDDSNAMGANARMFAKYCNTIKTFCTNKGITLVGVNQMREKPGVTFGDPRYAPGGNALKHMIDCRIGIKSVSNQNGTGQTEEEGTDIYRHYKVKIHKNKIFIPYKECQGRWWVESEGESGYGSCPVQDTLNYLIMTNQLVTTKEKNKKKHKIDLVDFDSKKYSEKDFKDIRDNSFNYKEFKSSVLKPEEFGINIREVCLDQLRSGVGLKLFLGSMVREG